MVLLGRNIRKMTVIMAAGVAVSMPLEPLHAQNFGNGLGQGLGEAFGNAIGDCLTGRRNCGQNNPTPRPQTTVRQRAPQPWSAARQQRASVQKALNDFGYPVGSADGVYGNNTARGMGQYQAAMGFPVTGSLNSWEEQALLNAHNSFKTGMHNSAYPGLFQNEGVAGLMRAHADPNYYNQRYGNNTQPQIANQPIPNNTGELVSNQPNQPALPQPGIVEQPNSVAPAVLPSIGKIGEVSASMQDHCDIVKLATQTNGGQITADAMVDPDQALGEQFCDARTFLMGRVQNVLGTARATEQELTAACGQIATNMAPLMSAVGTKAPETIAAEASGISGSLGLNDPAAAAEYGEVCIGLGYRTNDSDMALAGAVMLAGAGRMPFAEMIGHHVRQGFGTATNSQAAATWYNLGLDALANNQAPAVLPSQTIQRSAIIRAAVDAVDNPVLVGQQPPQGQLLAPLNLSGN